MAKQSRSNGADLSVDATADFLPGAQILLVDGQPGAEPSAPVNRFDQLQPLINWGPGNNHPQEVILKANQSPELLALITKLVSFSYGKGLYYEYYESAPVPGKPRPKYVEGFDPEVESFMEYNQLNDYYYKLLTDLVWFNHGFSELIKNKKGDKIVQIAHQEAAFCRFNRQNNQGYSDTVFINANWPSATYADALTIAVDSINTMDFNKVQTVMAADYYKLIYPLTFHSPGSCVYKSPNWQSLYTSKWYDVSVYIPIIKYAMMKFGMAIKYIIKVPQEFWVIHARDRGKDWDKLSAAQKKSLRKEINQEMNEFLAGGENAGKAFVTTFGWDKQRGVEIPGIQIIPVQDPTKDGALIPDSNEASNQFIRALDMTPSLVGFVSGKGSMGAGSGSGSRTDYNILNNSLEPKRDKSLTTLNFIGQVNGWTQRLPGFRWRVREFVLDTLDVNHNTSNPSPTKPNSEEDGNTDQ